MYLEYTPYIRVLGHKVWFSRVSDVGVRDPRTLNYRTFKTKSLTEFASKSLVSPVMANVAKHCVLLLKRRDRQEWKWTAIENNYTEHDDDADHQYHYRYRYNRHCLCHYYFCFIFIIIITIIIIVRKQHYPCFTARTESIKTRFQISCSLKNHALLLSYQRPWMLNLSDLPYKNELYINIHGEAYITRKVNSYPKIDIMWLTMLASAMLANDSTYRSSSTVSGPTGTQTCSWLGRPSGV